MKNRFCILAVMFVALCCFHTHTLAAGGNGSEECRIVQLNAQDFALVAIDNDRTKLMQPVVNHIVRAAKMAGEIDQECAICITQEFLHKDTVAMQTPCGPDPVIICGDGYLDPGEQCDDGNTDPDDGCSATCTLEVSSECGNGILEYGEYCDGTNMGGLICEDFNFDGGILTCNSNCMPDTTACYTEAVCGDGIVQVGEECDDGNNGDGDGCSAICTLENTLPVCGNDIQEQGEQCDGFDLGGLTCQSLGFDTGTLVCNDGCTLDTTPCNFNEAVCGNGVVEAGEHCDDGNTDETDACSECKLARCGDGYIQDGVETCDDGNTTTDDGCSATCQIEICGDGILQTGEECDDKNDITGDGCYNCMYESVPSGVDTDGDGWTVEGGDCDDNNPAVHPNASWNSSSTDPGNNFDWNCDGMTEKTVYGTNELIDIASQDPPIPYNIDLGHDVIGCGTTATVMQVLTHDHIILQNLEPYLWFKVSCR